MRTLVFATDFSDSANHALQYALFLAEKLRARLLVFHAYHYASQGGMYLSGELVADAQEQALRTAETRMNALLRRIRQSFPSLQLSSVLRQGLPVEELLAYAKRVQADLIIMGTRGEGADKEGFWGSVSAAVIERADHPVLTVPPSASYKPIERLLYATNFEEKELSLPPQLIALANALKARLCVLHVQQQTEKRQEALKALFEKELGKIELASGKIEFEVVQESDISQALIRFSAEYGADLLCMTTHHHSFWERLFRKPITHETLQEAALPMLIFHEQR
ncbi:MAG: universal stress protein [Bacteroidetes bacterium]|nr:MAG: universal stress protein [Bacteroidota bacterium]